MFSLETIIRSLIIRYEVQMFGWLVLLYQNRSRDQSEWFMLPPAMSGDAQFNHSSIHTLNDLRQLNLSAVSEPHYSLSE